MDKRDFLLELGCEELPHNYQVKLSKSIENKIIDALDEACISHHSSTCFSTPRRLAVLIEDLAMAQPTQKVNKEGPRYKDAYTQDGRPTLACIGFARSCGVSTDQLEIKETEKGKRIFCRLNAPGKPTIDMLETIIKDALKKISFSKPMRWGSNDYSFIRPVKWVIVLFGQEIVTMSIWGIKNSQKTFGHRFHEPKKIKILEPKDYYPVLYSKGHVISDPIERKDLVKKLIHEATSQNEKAIINPALLDEVTSLVEWPAVYVGNYDFLFLSLPREVLITSMSTHLKFFPIEDKQGVLLPKFLFVSNILPKNPSLLIRGNEKVLNARLSDANFFYQNDLKISLKKRFKMLSNVVFQKQLGSMKEKADRLKNLSEHIAKKIDSNIEDAKEAALLSKCDLVSEMVLEFQELQGTIGYYYALNEGKTRKCALAIRDQYFPRFSGDQLPQTVEACIVALSDRIDSLVGFFGINEIPTGDKDPYALRRNALGIVRIMIEKNLSLNLHQLLEKSIENYSREFPNKNILSDSYHFCLSRLKVWYSEKGVSSDVFEAVNACNPSTISDFHCRIKVIKKFQNLPEAKALSEANKRVANVLKKNHDKIPNKVNPNLIEKSEERRLFLLLKEHKNYLEKLKENKDYKKILTSLSALKDPINDFFNNVMIMVDNEKIKLNRLALLKLIRNLFIQVADISLLQ